MASKTPSITAPSADLANHTKVLGQLKSLVDNLGMTGKAGWADILSGIAGQNFVKAAFLFTDAAAAIQQAVDYNAKVTFRSGTIAGDYQSSFPVGIFKDANYLPFGLVMTAAGPSVLSLGDNGINVLKTPTAWNFLVAATSTNTLTRPSLAACLFLSFS